MLSAFKKVLLVSPHTDDCELGMGATIAKLVSYGCDITWVVCSNAVKSLPEGFSDTVLIEEQIESARRLRIDRSNLLFWDFPVRCFPSNRQAILESLMALPNKADFQAVFCPASSDCHQDHSTMQQEVKRAFKTISIFGYELPWNDFENKYSFFVPFDAYELEKKIHAIRAYESQAHRAYMNPAFIEGVGRYRGAPINVPYAEAFETIRVVE